MLKPIAISALLLSSLMYAPRGLGQSETASDNTSGPVVPNVPSLANTLIGDESSLLAAARKAASPFERSRAYELFMDKFPDSFVRSLVLRELLVSYESQADVANTIATARRLLDAQPHNVAAICDLIYYTSIKMETVDAPGERASLEREITDLLMRGRLSTEPPNSIWAYTSGAPPISDKGGTFGLPGADLSPGDLQELSGPTEHPGYISFGNHEKVWALFDSITGWRQLEQGDYLKAQAILSTVVEREPDNELASYWLSQSYLLPTRLKEKDVAKGLWFAARSIVLASIPQERDRFMTFGLQYYAKVQGSEEGWNELLAEAKEAVFPKHNFKLPQLVRRAEVSTTDSVAVELDQDVLENLRSSKQVTLNGESVQIKMEDNNKVRFLGGSPKPGANIIETARQRMIGLFDGWSFTSFSPYKPNRSYAILVAIDDYDRKKAKDNRGKTGFDPITGMVRNAEALKEALIRLGFPRANITTLYDQQAESWAIEKALQAFWIGGAHSDADRLFFYFGGHGSHIGKSGFLITYDYDPHRPTSTTLLMQDLTQRHSQNLVPHHVLFALDACSSGLALPTLGNASIDPMLARKRRTAAILKNDTEPEARNVLVAGTGDQDAALNPAGTSGIFTDALVEGLKGSADLNGDGIIQFGELALWVKDRVAEMLPQISSRIKQEVGYYKLTAYGTGEIAFIMEAH